jgi:hypothetical protein
MTILEYAELILLRKRLSLLETKESGSDEFPDIDFTLREVQDIYALISALQSVTRVYDRD